MLGSIDSKPPCLIRGSDMSDNYGVIAALQRIGEAMVAVAVSGFVQQRADPALVIEDMPKRLEV